MGFVEGQTMSDGKDKILVVVSKLTKYAHFLRMQKSDSTKQIIEIFYKNVYKLHGFPKLIVSDRDIKFKGNLWKEIFKHIGTCLNMSLAYHPQTDNQTEVFNKCLEAFLHCYAIYKQNKWAQ